MQAIALAILQLTQGSNNAPLPSQRANGERGNPRNPISSKRIIDAPSSVAYKDLARLMQVNETQAHFASCTQAAVACSCLPCQIPAATQQTPPQNLPVVGHCHPLCTHGRNLRLRSPLQHTLTGNTPNWCSSCLTPFPRSRAPNSEHHLHRVATRGPLSLSLLPPLSVCTTRHTDTETDR